MPIVDQKFYIPAPTRDQSRYRRLYVPPMDATTMGIEIHPEKAPRGLTSFWKLKYFLVWLDTSAAVGNRFILSDIKSQILEYGVNWPLIGFQTGQIPANYATAIKWLPGGVPRVQTGSSLTLYEVNAAGHAELYDMIITSDEFLWGQISAPLAGDVIWAQIMLEYLNDVEGITEGE